MKCNLIAGDDTSEEVTTPRMLPPASAAPPPPSVGASSSTQVPCASSSSSTVLSNPSSSVVVSTTPYHLQVRKKGGTRWFDVVFLYFEVTWPKTFHLNPSPTFHLSSKTLLFPNVNTSFMIKIQDLDKLVVMIIHCISLMSQQILTHTLESRGNTYICEDSTFND